MFPYSINIFSRICDNGKTPGLYFSSQEGSLVFPECRSHPSSWGLELNEHSKPIRGVANYITHTRRSGSAGVPITSHRKSGLCFDNVAAEVVLLKPNEYLFFNFFFRFFVVSFWALSACFAFHKLLSGPFYFIPVVHTKSV